MLGDTDYKDTVLKFLDFTAGSGLPHGAYTKKNAGSHSHFTNSSEKPGLCNHGIFAERCFLIQGPTLSALNEGHAVLHDAGIKS